jgi:Ca-activated chloride channel family protein
MDDIFEQIALELRHQYSIGYRPANFTNDGKWHKIKVKLTPPRACQGFSPLTKKGITRFANPR